MLEVMADYFNVDMDYLICRTDKNKGEMEIRAMRYYEKLCNLSEENQKLVEAMIDKLSEIKD